MADWDIILQQNQMRINKDNILKNRKIVYHDFTVKNKVMLNNNAAFKYKTPYKGLFEIS